MVASLEKCSIYSQLYNAVFLVDSTICDRAHYSGRRSSSDVPVVSRFHTDCECPSHHSIHCACPQAFKVQANIGHEDRCSRRYASNSQDPHIVFPFVGFMLTYNTMSSFSPTCLSPQFTLPSPPPMIGFHIHP